MKRSILVMLGVVLGASGCKTEDDDKGYSDAELAAYKSALPSRSTLTAPNPEASAVSFAAADAIYPGFAVPIAVDVNGLVGGTLNLIEAIAEHEPSFYDSEKLEFWWGPIPDSDSALEGDHWSLYIHDQTQDADYDPAQDLKYEFAVIRGIGNDLADMTPVLYGVATPDELNEDHGIGAMIYDFDNNVLFEDEHNAGHGALTSGRMATIFLKGPEENNPDATISMVIAAFRDFLPDDAAPGSDPISVDYFWGNFTDLLSDFDFLTLVFDANVAQQSSALEEVTLKLGFYNDGIGRAQADVVGGDIAAGDAHRVEECWDAALQQTYVAAFADSGSGFVLAYEDGTESSCVWDDATFTNEVPDLADTGEMAALVQAIADNPDGIPSEVDPN